jgi:hypothetical protein
MGHGRWNGRMRRPRGRPGNHGGDCEGMLGGLLLCRDRDTYAAWSNVLFHFSCCHGYWVGCRLYGQIVSFMFSTPIPPIYPDHHIIRLGRNSPFFSRCHGIDTAAKLLVVPGGRTEGEDGGTDGEGVVLQGRGGGARCRSRALYHPIRQPCHQIISQSLRIIC